MVAPSKHHRVEVVVVSLEGRAEGGGTLQRVPAMSILRKKGGRRRPVAVWDVDIPGGSDIGFQGRFAELLPPRQASDQERGAVFEVLARGGFDIPLEMDPREGGRPN